MAAMSTDQPAAAAATNDAAEILAFWFGAGEEYSKRRPQWFRKSEAFDGEIRTRFLACYQLAAAGRLANWQDHALHCLALIIVLDQFPRNMFRGSARAFATDELARTATRHALAHGFDRNMKPVERQFIYLPLEHSESLDDQQLCLKLMHELSPFAQTDDLHVWAEKHRVIIARFGRFPHRNAALGRKSTEEEIKFLREPGSGF
jgi:uncharacterized protein (DUF924 family)